jgi:PAS domain S-box-containing protein
MEKAAEHKATRDDRSDPSRISLERQIQELERTRRAILNILEDTAESKAALEASEARFRDLYQHAPIMYHTLDLDGNILECNEEILQNLGYQREEYVGHNIREFMPPDYQEMVGQTLSEIVRKGKVKRLRRDYVCKDGSVLPTEISARLVRDETGRPTAIHSALVDITDRLKRERVEKQALIESRLRSEVLRVTMQQVAEEVVVDRIMQDIANIYRDVLEVDGVVIFHYSPERGYFVNCAIAVDDEVRNQMRRFIPNYRGYMTFQILKNKVMMRLIHGEKAVVSDSFDLFGASEIIKAHSTLFPNAKLLLIPIKPYGEPWGLVGIITRAGHLALELTPSIREHLEQGILRLEELNRRIRDRKEIERLANFPQESPAPVIEVNSRGKLTYINPAGEALMKRLGKTRQTIKQILPKQYRQLVRESLKTGQDIPPQEVNLGNLVLLWIGHPLPGHRLVHFYATDITELKQTEQELVKARERAEASDRLKSVFLSTMSHEVRTPLNVILGYTDLLYTELQGKLNQDLETFFDSIRESGNRLQQLIDDILDVSQIEADRLTLRSEEILADELVHATVQEFRLTVKEKGLDLQESLGAPDVYIKVDRLRLQQVLGNILTNAIKFTHEGGITVTTEKQNAEYRVRVRDTGIGVRDEFKPYLFALFRQGEEGYDRSYEGAGLGLAISQKLVTAMGGRIEVESKVGKGSEFTVVLPVVRVRKVRARKPEPQPEMTKTVLLEQRIAPRFTVLALEDNQANMNYLKFLLKKLKLKCLPAETGEQALQVINETPPDIMLIDISLAEGMSGLEFLERVSGLRRFRKVPKIAVTAHAMKGKREEFLRAGFDDYLAKPFTLKDLEKVLARNLPYEQ